MGIEGEEGVRNDGISGRPSGWITMLTEVWGTLKESRIWGKMMISVETC